MAFLQLHFGGKTREGKVNDDANTGDRMKNCSSENNSDRISVPLDDGKKLLMHRKKKNRGQKYILIREGAMFRTILLRSLKRQEQFTKPISDIYVINYKWR